MYPVTLKRCKLSAWNMESDVSRQGSVQFWVQWTESKTKNKDRLTASSYRLRRLSYTPWSSLPPPFPPPPSPLPPLGIKEGVIESTKFGAGKIALLLRTLVWFPAPQGAGVCNWNSRESNSLFFCGLQGHQADRWYTDIHASQIVHTHEINRQ